MFYIRIYFVLYVNNIMIYGIHSVIHEISERNYGRGTNGLSKDSSHNKLVTPKVKFSGDFLGRKKFRIFFYYNLTL